MTPTDTAERARPPYSDPIWDTAARVYGFAGMPNTAELFPQQMKIIERAVNALAEARRGALNECARWHDERYVDLRDNGERGPNGLASGMTGARMYEHREAAEHFRALAAPEQGGADDERK